MSEETRVTVTEHPATRRFLFWIGSISSVIIIGVAGYGVFLVRQYVPYVGIAILIAVSLLPTVGVVFLITMLLKYMFRGEYIEIGPTGTIIKWFNRVTEYHPLGIKDHKGGTSREKKEQENITIPTLLDLLKENFFGGIDLLLGFHLDGTMRWGTWDDVRTFVVAGKSRSGKTVTMVFFIIQALLAGAKVWVCDPHWNKRTGLLKVLEPLIPFLRVAKTTTEIMKLVTDFKNEMNSRESGTSEMGLIPILLVIDEWTKLLRDLDPVETALVVDTILDCAEAWANFEGYAMIAGHEWTARESGGKKGAALRRGMHAAFVHRIDEDYAKFLLVGGKGKKAAKNAPNLPTGHTHFQDSEGELDYLLIPYYGAKKEAVYETALMLKALLTGTPDMKLLNGPDPEDYYKNYGTPFHQDYTVNGTANSKQDMETPVNKPVESIHTEGVTVSEVVNTSKLNDVSNSVNGEDVNALTETERIILRLRKKNIAHRDISYAVGLYGRDYDKYVELCKKLGIPTDEK